MRESKQKMNFILKHGYELPAMIPLVLFGLFESQSVFNIALRDLREVAHRIPHLLKRPLIIMQFIPFLQ